MNSTKKPPTAEQIDAAVKAVEQADLKMTEHYERWTKSRNLQEKAQNAREKKWREKFRR